MGQRKQIDKPDADNGLYDNAQETYSAIDSKQEDLKREIELHAESRMRFYFRFIFYVSSITSRLNKKSKKLLRATDFVDYKATHQWGSGHRKKDVGAQESTHKTERKSDDFRSVDAAHKCGLGISPSLTKLVEQSEDPSVKRLYEEIMRVISDTRLLPQRVNIGPDKIIDELHRKRAKDDLAGISSVVPIFNQHVAATYLSHAYKEMEVYREKNRQIMTGDKSSKKGDSKSDRAMYAGIYLNFYRNWENIHRIVTSEVRIYCIDANKYGV